VSLLLAPCRISEGSQGSHRAPYTALLGGSAKGSFYFPAHWGCLQSGALTVHTNDFLISVTVTLGESETPVQTSGVIIFWVITVDFLKALLVRSWSVTLCEVVTPHFCGIKIQWFHYATVIFCSFLTTKTSQSVLHSDCFDWFIHISLEFKRFRTAKWS